MNFATAFERVVGHEGGLSMDKHDRGNWTGGAVGRGELRGTRYGVSCAAYPGEDIANLTMERAGQLYLRDYWSPAGCDVVPEPVKFDLFDMAINSGVSAAIKALQKAVGETQDGVFGPRTIKAAQSMPALRTLARFNGARLLQLTDSPTWPSHGRGWARRVAANLLQS